MPSAASELFTIHRGVSFASGEKRTLEMVVSEVANLMLEAIRLEVASLTSRDGNARSPSAQETKAGET